MQRTRRLPPAGPLWLVVLALLLRAAMPFAASAAAERQGLAIGEVCSVYGVVHDVRPRDDAPASPVAGHGGDHCVLGALAALGTVGSPPRLALPPRAAHREAVPVETASRRHDAAADWVARRKQGPPAFA